MTPAHRRAYQQAAWQAQQIRAGKCPACTRKLAPGARRCHRCLAQHRARERARYYSTKTAGRCRHCHHPIVKGSTVFCERHLRIQRENSQFDRDRKAAA